MFVVTKLDVSHLFQAFMASEALVGRVMAKSLVLNRHLTSPRNSAAFRVFRFPSELQFYSRKKEKSRSLRGFSNFFNS